MRSCLKSRLINQSLLTVDILKFNYSKNSYIKTFNFRLGKVLIWRNVQCLNSTWLRTSASRFLRVFTVTACLNIWIHVFALFYTLPLWTDGISRKYLLYGFKIQCMFDGQLETAPQYLFFKGQISSIQMSKVSKMLVPMCQHHMGSWIFTPRYMGLTYLLDSFAHDSWYSIQAFKDLSKTILVKFVLP